MQSMLLKSLLLLFVAALLWLAFGSALSSGDTVQAAERPLAWTTGSTPGPKIVPIETHVPDNYGTLDASLRRDKLRAAFARPEALPRETIEVQLVSSVDGRPLAGAELWSFEINSPDDSRWQQWSKRSTDPQALMDAGVSMLRSDAEGRIQLPRPKSFAALFIRSGDLERACTVQRASESPLIIKLHERRELAVRVLDQGGQPQAGVPLRLEDAQTGVALMGVSSDESGRALFARLGEQLGARSLPAGMALAFDFPGAGDQLLAMQLDSLPPDEVRMQMPPSVTLDLSLFDAGGRAYEESVSVEFQLDAALPDESTTRWSRGIRCAGSRVSIWPVGLDSPIAVRLLDEGGGLLSCGRLAPLASDGLADGFGAAVVLERSLRIGAPPAQEPSVAAASHVASGRLLLDEGIPVEWLRVSFESDPDESEDPGRRMRRIEAGDPCAAKLEQDGSFYWPSARSGRGRLRVDLLGEGAALVSLEDVEVSATSFQTIDLRGLLQLVTVHISGAEGEPVSGVELWPVDAGTRSVIAVHRATSADVMLLRRSGEQELLCMAPGYAPMVLKHAAGASRLQLERGPRLQLSAPENIAELLQEDAAGVFVEVELRSIAQRFDLGKARIAHFFEGTRFVETGLARADERVIAQLDASTGATVELGLSGEWELRCRLVEKAVGGRARRLSLGGQTRSKWNLDQPSNVIRLDLDSLELAAALLEIAR